MINPLYFSSGELLKAEELPSGPVLVDNMNDEASTAYGAQPERLYIILDGRIVYQVTSKANAMKICNDFHMYFKGGVGPWLYKPEEVNSWLEKHFS